MWPNPQETADLDTFTGEILNGKLYFLCSEFTILTTSEIKEVEDEKFKQANKNAYETCSDKEKVRSDMSW